MSATRRRGTALVEALLEAGWDSLLAGGYQGLNFEDVAARAKTGKAALYRRWPDKEALLLAILAHKGFDTPVEAPNTGSLRGDVLALMNSANRFGEATAALISTILGAYFDETETTPGQLHARLLGDRSQAMAQIVRRAIERGELPGPLPPRILSLPLDLMRHEFFMTLSRVPEATITDIVDTIFLPLAMDPASSTNN